MERHNTLCDKIGIGWAVMVRICVLLDEATVVIPYCNSIRWYSLLSVRSSSIGQPQV